MTRNPQSAARNTQKRENAIVMAIEKHGYRQREISGHREMYFSSINRIVNAKKLIVMKGVLALLYECCKGAQSVLHFSCFWRTYDWFSPSLVC